MNELYKALHIARKQFSTVKKNGTNPHFKSKYADLESILDAVEKSLDDNNLLIITRLATDKVITDLIHTESGQSVTSEYPLNAGLTDQQKGSAITYGRRYSIQSLLNLVAEDDDGNQASNRRETKPEPKSFDGIETAKRSQAFIESATDATKLEAGLVKFKGYKPDYDRANMKDIYSEVITMFELKKHKLEEAF